MDMIEHRKRIIKDLKTAGMTNYGLLKLEVGHLPDIIHENEHIGGVVYGRTMGNKVGSAMLIATDKRVIFIDSKPLFTESDEISYYVVSGVKLDTAGPFAAITLHTKVRDFGLRFVNQKCARQFVKFIEHFIEQVGDDETPQKVTPPGTNIAVNTKKDRVDLHAGDDTAILSTVSQDNQPHGAVIHYVTDQDENYYILTKEETTKAKNMQMNNRVALTIYRSHSLRVLSISGVAEQITDKDLFQHVYGQIARSRQYTEGTKLAPISKLNAGKFVAYKIVPTDTIVKNYGTSSW